ncbi:MAG: cell division protein ZapA [Rhodobacteraceae bacterium]|nr:cell division protein ZapA [Paracoccaceae bacterium]
MAEVKIAIGGREFEVACRSGEEHFLKSAAAMLDNEAAALNKALGRMPESRMLLMAGLMLADKTASLEDQLKNGTKAGEDPAVAKRAQKAENQLGKAQAALAEAKAQLAEAEAALAKKEEAAGLAQETSEAAVEMMNRMVSNAEAAAEDMKKAG